MLERLLPNLYGWLFWGGGLHLIRSALKVVAIIALLASLFMLGMWYGGKG